MESLLLSVRAITPIFLLLALGYGLKQIRMVPEVVFDGMNTLTFKVFLPVLLFLNLYRTDLGQVLNVELMIFTVTGILLLFGVGYLLVMKLTPSDAKRGAMLQGMFRSNYAILGVTVVDYICGDATVGLASLLVAVVVPLYNVLAVICLERFRGGKPDPKKMLKGVVTNPLIIGCAVGMLFLVLGIPLPDVVDETLTEVGGVASPLSMIALGAGFAFSDTKGYRKELAVTISTKLVIAPAIVLSVAAAMGFRGEALAVIMVVFGAPVAVTSFPMAQAMGSDGPLAGQIVVVSSAVCLLTLFGWIFLLSSLGLF